MHPASRQISKLLKELSFKCKTCEQVLKLDAMMEHLKQVCHKEVVKCPLEESDKAASFTLGQLKEHLKVCPALFAKCLKCGEQMGMDKKKDHTFSNCISNFLKQNDEKEIENKDKEKKESKQEEEKKQ